MSESESSKPNHSAWYTKTGQFNRISLQIFQAISSDMKEKCKKEINGGMMQNAGREEEKEEGWEGAVLNSNDQTTQK